MVHSSKTIPFVLPLQFVVVESDVELQIVRAKSGRLGKNFAGKEGKEVGKGVEEVL